MKELASCYRGDLPALTIVVGLFTEIKTGYQGFETNEIRYFVCLLLALIISHLAYMNQNLATGNGFCEILKSTFAQYKVKM